MGVAGRRGRVDGGVRAIVSRCPCRADAIGKDRRNIKVMRESAVREVIEGLKSAEVSLVCYLPDSLLKELYPALDRMGSAENRHHDVGIR